MADILVQFDEPQRSADGISYIAQVCGRLASDDIWEAWIEFIPIDGRDPIRTARETEQFTRGDLRYWAARLNRAYLDEALARALTHTPYALPASVPFESRPDEEHIVFETDALVRAVPVVDPFALYRQSGAHTLRQELRSLSARQLQDIVAAYEIPDLEIHDTQRTFEDAIAEQIVAEVQQRVGSGHLDESRNRAVTHQN